MSERKVEWYARIFFAAAVDDTPGRDMGHDSGPFSSQEAAEEFAISAARQPGVLRVKIVSKTVEG